MRSFILLILVVVMCGSLSAQPDKNQKFAAAAYLGANFSQIDGDYYFGYNRVGLRFGLESQLLIKPKYFMSLGVGYSQAGANASRSERNDRKNNSVNLRLNMAEVPLIFHYRLGPRDAYSKKKNFQLYRSGTVQVGAILTRLTSFKTTQTGRPENLPRNQNFVSVSDNFENWDLKALIGFSVRTGFKGSIFIQHNKSLRGLYRPGNVGLKDVLPLYPYSFFAGFKYTLF